MPAVSSKTIRMRGPRARRQRHLAPDVPKGVSVYCTDETEECPCGAEMTLYRLYLKGTTHSQVRAWPEALARVHALGSFRFCDFCGYQISNF